MRAMQVQSLARPAELPPVTLSPGFTTSQRIWTRSDETGRQSFALFSRYLHASRHVNGVTQAVLTGMALHMRIG
jgi:hypothetical protein